MGIDLERVIRQVMSNEEALEVANEIGRLRELPRSVRRRLSRVMQKLATMLSFAHPESGPSGSQTGAFGISRQPYEAWRCAKPCLKTLKPTAARKRMGKRTR